MDDRPLLIVDCSHWNESLDCHTLTENGVIGVILKATQGDDQLDPKFILRLADAQEAGLLTGAYHWLDPAAPAARQAEAFVKHAGAAGLLALDLEQYWTDWSDRKNPLKRFSPGEIAACAREWLALVEKTTGRRPVVYTAAWFVDHYLAGNADWLREYPLWLAHYVFPKTPPVVCSWQALYQRYLPKTSGPLLPKGCSRWVLWQFTGDKFTLPGATGRLDVNLAWGSIEEVRALFNQRVPTLLEMVQCLWEAHPDIKNAGSIPAQARSPQEADR